MNIRTIEITKCCECRFDNECSYAVNCGDIPDDCPLERAVDFSGKEFKCALCGKPIKDFEVIWGNEEMDKTYRESKAYCVECGTKLLKLGELHW